MYGSVQDFRKLCKNITWKKEVKKKKKNLYTGILRIKTKKFKTERMVIY